MKPAKVFPDKRAVVWGAALVVACITFLVYLPALQNDFINLDDDVLVYENQHIKSIDLRLLRWAITDVSTGLWHPLLWLSFALDYATWELNPAGYHLTNIILHAVNTFLVFILVIRFLEAGSNDKEKPHKRPIIAGIVTALLFGVHPMRVESVAWIAERKDVLYAFFYLLSLLVYLRYASANSKKYYLLCLVFFVLSLMSKPMAVSLPIVLLILDFYPLKRLGGSEKVREVLIEKLPFLLLSLLLSAATVWIHPLGGGLQAEDMEIFSPQARVFAAVRLYLFYLMKITLPFNPAPIYPPLLRSGLFSFEGIGAFIGVAGLILFSIWLLKRSKMLSAVWFYYLATLLPVMGQVGAQSMASRYTYLPSLGPLLLIGIGTATLFERYLRKEHRFILITALLLPISIFVIKTTRHIGIWKDPITLWSHEIKRFPASRHEVYRNRGAAYYKLGYYQHAIEDLNKAARFKPQDPSVYTIRGSVYEELGNYGQAINDYSKAIEIKPGYAKAYHNRGFNHSRLGNYRSAIEDFNKTIELDPQSAVAYNNRGIVYTRLGDNLSAINDFNKAIEIKPQYAKAYYNLGFVYSRLGDMKQAGLNYKKAANLGLREAQDFSRKQGTNWTTSGNSSQ